MSRGRPFVPVQLDLFPGSVRAAHEFLHEQRARANIERELAWLRNDLAWELEKLSAYRRQYAMPRLLAELHGQLASVNEQLGAA